MIKVNDLKVVSKGGIFCDCGGLMTADGGCLMSSPPKQKVTCPFCGSFDYTEYPYNVDIHFKIEKPQ